MKNNFLKILNLTVLMNLRAHATENREVDTPAAQPSLIALKEQPEHYSEVAKPINQEVKISKRTRVYRRKPFPLSSYLKEAQTTLDLSNQNFQYEQWLDIDWEVKNYPQVTILNLRDSNIDDSMISTIGSIIYNLSAIEKVDLSHNNIRDKGLEIIMNKSEKKPTLKKIDLSYNLIHKLAYSIHRNLYLEELDLSYNYMANWGSDLDMLAKNHALKKLIITNQARREENIKSIRESAKLDLELYAQDPYGENITMEIIY